MGFAPKAFDAPPAESWVVQRPWWASCLAWGLGAAAVICLAYASFLLLAPALFVVWRWRAHPRLGLFPPIGLLYAHHQGDWEFVQDRKGRLLVLHQVWPGPFWTTLRFGDPPSSHQKDGMLELTLWKSTVMPQAWRRLQILAARQLIRAGQQATGALR